MRAFFILCPYDDPADFVEDKKERNVFKKAFLWVLFAAAVLMLLGYYFTAPGVHYSITVNGEEIQGLPGAALATGGLLAAGLAVAGALALVALALAGASMVLLGVFAVFFVGLLFVLSPVWAPVAGVAIVIALIVRKRSSTKTHDAGTPRH